MTFRLLHALTFSAVPLLGVLALQTAEAIPVPLAVAGLASILAGIALPEELRARVPSAVTAGLPVALVAVAAVALTRGTEPVLVAVAFSIALQALRVATRQGATHDPQIVILAILHLVAAAVLGGTLGFGACLLAFVLVAPSALTLSHLRREVERNYEAGAKDRAGRRVDVERILRSKRVAEPKWVVRSLALAPFVLAFTAVLFLVVPRVGLAMFLLKPPSGVRSIGFSSTVDLGAMGELQANEALAARVDWKPPAGTPEPNVLPFYLRGTAFDEYTGKSWRKADDLVDVLHTATVQRASVVYLGPTPHKPSELRVRLEPLDEPVLFVPSGARVLRFESADDPTQDLRVYPGAEGEWRFDVKRPTVLRYRVDAETDRSPPLATLSPQATARYLQLPASLDPRIRELAGTVVGDAPPPERPARLAAYLRERYRYGLAAKSGGAADPLADFLFRTREGHCEFFSTALAVMLRTQGIPSRNVTGFVGATRNAFGGYYSVRQQNAHSWVEYWNALGDHTGRWETLDATPAATEATQARSRLGLLELYEALAARWDRNVAAFDVGDQAALAQRLARPLESLERRIRAAIPRREVALVLIGAGLAVVYAWHRRRRTRATHPVGPTNRSASRHRAESFARALERVLGARGSRSAHETMREYGARVCPPAVRTPLDDVLALYEAMRWGDAPADEPALRAKLAHLERALADAPTDRTTLGG